MTLENYRYSLTKHIKKVMFTYENFKLLIHPEADNSELLIRLHDDLNLMPEIESTLDNTKIKFYKYDYKEEIFSKSELLAFILASINEDWDIVKLFDIHTCRVHYCLKNGREIYDPSLSVITLDNLYFKRFKPIGIIKNNEVLDYLKVHNNLYRFYHKGLFSIKDKNFSVNFINGIKEKFDDNFRKQYMLDEKKIRNIKEFFWRNTFNDFRQVLTCSRVSSLQKSIISVHPDVDKSILSEIDKCAKGISELMEKEYNVDADYYSGTIGNCYLLSIMMNLFNGDFKLVQGGIPFKKGSREKFYQHSWLEYKDVVYDPAFRLVTPKDLYYIFVEKHDEYTKEETENMLKRIGFNFTHFKDFLRGVQIGGDETIRYRSLANKVDSEEFKKEGEKLLSLVKLYR